MRKPPAVASLDRLWRVELLLDRLSTLLRAAERCQALFSEYSVGPCWPLGAGERTSERGFHE